MNKLIRFNDIEQVPASFTTILDRMFEDISRDSGISRFNPMIDVSESKENFEIKVALPGMKKDDFNIELNNNQLIISGERKFEKEDKDRTYHVIESRYGKFTRVFDLPDIVKADGIDASYTDGILNITVPKDEKKTTARQIQVK